MTRKQQKEQDKKKGGKKEHHYVPHPELGSGGASHEERTIRNLIVSKDIAGVTRRMDGAEGAAAIVQKIAAEGSALSLYAAACLLVGEFIFAIREVLACFSGEASGADRFLDLMTTQYSNKATEAFRDSAVLLFGEADATTMNSETVEQLILGRFALPTDGRMADANVIAFHYALEKEAPSNKYAAHLQGLFSVPKRMEQFRKMLAEEDGVQAAGKILHLDVYNTMALERLSLESTEVGTLACAALCYFAAYMLMESELSEARYDIVQTKEFIERFSKLPMDADGLAMRLSFYELAKEHTSIGFFAARISTVMTDAIARMYFEKLAACKSEEVARWIMNELMIQQSMALAPFLDACLGDCGLHVLSTRAQEIRRCVEGRKSQEVGERVLVNL